jgi:2-polyprenyl-3-methyl-5-hydroxy-6-metoxy-1,4-benzoquinol methylase
MLADGAVMTRPEASTAAGRDVHADELRAGERFAFGANWRRFLDALTPDQIDAAEASLTIMLQAPSLTGRTFLDVGSGSGLFSLAARRLGATVRSFDYDPESVACTRELRRQYLDDDPGWVVERGSILDEAYLAGLGGFDIVYAWGSLHHTGAMWRAIDHAARLVAPGGCLFLSIYNDQGVRSTAWRQIKRTYCANAAGRVAVTVVAVPLLAAREVVARLVRPRRGVAVRGMSLYRDWIDWLGGYPFEVATPEAILTFCGARGLDPRKLVTTTRLGCNQFVLARPAA